MCGIVGLARLSSLDLFEKDRDVFLQLLNTGLVRGHHGTGVFAINKDGAAHIVKSAGPPYMLMIAPEFTTFWNTIKVEKTQILIGHNRFATTGQKISKHAHPFTKEHIVMVHNGSLDAASTIPDYTKYAVDSEALAASIAALGIEETIKNTLGAYAIVFWDKKAHTLNMIRNSERPLFIAIDKGVNRLIMASERDMLTWILKRNFYDVPLADVAIHDLPPNRLWSFEMDSCEPKETTILGKTRTTVYAGYAGEHYRNDEWDTVQGKWVKKGNTTVYEIDDVRKRIIDGFLASTQPPRVPYNQTTTLKLVAPMTQVETTTPQPPRDPRLKEVFVNTKDYIAASMLQNPDKTQTLARGDKISVMISDYVPENSVKQHYIVIALNEAWPDCRFQFRVEQDGVLDALFEAVEVEITIQNILEPGKHAKDPETIVWANKPTFSVGEAVTTVH